MSENEVSQVKVPQVEVEVPEVSQVEVQVPEVSQVEAGGSEPVKALKARRSNAKANVTRYRNKLSVAVAAAESVAQVEQLLERVESYMKEAEEANFNFCAACADDQQTPALQWLQDVTEATLDVVDIARAYITATKDVGSLDSVRSGRSSSKRSSKKVHSSSSVSARRAAEVERLRAEQVQAEAERQLAADKQKLEEEARRLQEAARRRVQDARDKAALAELNAQLSQACSSVGGSVLEVGSGTRGSQNPMLEPFLEAASSAPVQLLDISAETEPAMVSKPLVPQQPRFGLSQQRSQPSCISSRSMPKLSLGKFDGSASQWAGWYSQYQGLIGNQPISRAEKMAHLQGGVSGLARTVIEGYGYNEAFLEQALEDLRHHFGRPELVVHSCLDKLQKAQPPSASNSQSIMQFSLLVNSLVRTFQELQYGEDLVSASNLKTAVDKLPHSLALKWHENIVDKGIQRPDLLLFNDWLKRTSAVFESLHPIDVKAVSKPVVVPRAFATSADRAAESTGGFVDFLPGAAGSGASGGFVDFLPGAAVSGASGGSGHGAAGSGANGGYVGFVPGIAGSGARGGGERGVAGSGTREGQFRRACVFGDGDHHLSNCSKFKALPEKERAVVVKDNKLCFRCFNPGHVSRFCKKPMMCSIDGCTGSHHPMLHGAPKVFAAAAEHVFTNSGKVLLQVVPVVLYGKTRSVRTFALLDQGSTASLIRSSVADQLDGGHLGTESIELNGVNGSRRCSVRRVSLHVSSVEDSVRHAMPNVLVLDNLNLPSQKCDVFSHAERFPHLRGLPFVPAPSSEVSVLIGADCFSLIASREVRLGPPNTPSAVRTVFGWSLVGQLPDLVKESAQEVFHVSLARNDEELYRQVAEFWRFESYGLQPSAPVSVDDQRALSVLESTTKLVDGRYEVGMLWKQKATVLPKNYSVAAAQFYGLEKKLGRNPDLMSMYKLTVDTDVLKSFVRKVLPPELSVLSSRDWFLPHHPVSNPNKPGKVRRVCNAASICRGTSLNDQLVSGPDLLASLVGVLFRFRQDAVAFSADIESMFLQVSVPPDDRKALRFLWRDSPSETLDVYQYERHIFGAKCSPACAIFALRRTAADHRAEFPVAAQVIERDFYMDDLIKSSSTVEKASALFRDLRIVLGRGGFNLVKWSSSSSGLLASIPESLQAQCSSLPEAQQKVLGVTWDIRRDCLSLSVSSFAPLPSVCITQRALLSIISSVFDPLGLVSPFVLRGRLLFQQLWRFGPNWDKEVDVSLLPDISAWLSEFHGMATVSVPRCYTSAAVSSRQLHVFGDASMVAYSAVAYIRFQLVTGESVVRFVMGKCRVAPIKQQSVPKLELQAAVLAARMLKVVLSEHSFEFSSFYCWSDSSTVVQWIRNQHLRHQVFVANRLAEILETTMASHWRFVPGKLNPADDGTRGLLSSELSSDCRWLTGPAFLEQSQDAWPVDMVFSGGVADVPSPFVEVVDVASFQPALLDATRFSSWSRLLRVTARVMRVFTPKVSREPFLSVAELRRAETYWLKFCQSESFRRELQCLGKSKALLSSSKLLPLSPYVDEDGLLRARGRLRHAPLPVVSKYPIILDGTHHVVRLLLVHLHLSHHHEGVEYTRSIVQERFWVLRVRSSLRSIVHACIPCKKRRAKSAQPLMADLPPSRLVGQDYAFSNVGLDYFGPFGVKVRRSVQKRYCALFTCLRTRAVHIEVCHSLDADSCIMAIRRFIARRGKPTRIVSDNGTNFVGACEEMRQALARWSSEHIHNSLAQDGILWQFNPPAAPHFGGVWERLVKSCKRTMYAVLGCQSLTEEVLVTVMAEVESILNSRPLIAVSDDIRDFEALTPNHFLLGRPSPNLPADVRLEGTCHRKRWRQAQALTNHVWSRWHRQYVPQLLPRAKWHSDEANLRVGDLVWLVEVNVVRGQWPLARVVEVFPSLDGVVRSATVKTAHSTYKRPATRLVPLEVEKCVFAGTEHRAGCDVGLVVS